MRTLRIFQHISLDGIIQQTPDENSFPYTDWTVPYRSPAGRDKLFAAYGTNFDLLLGRRTYDLWSTHWPTAPASPFTDPINNATKHVVTHHPDTLSWGPHQALGPDLLAGVQHLKEQPGPDLILCGSSTLAAPLLEHGLAEELFLINYPVLLGTGKPLFPSNTPARSFDLVSSESLASGVILSRYKASGGLKPA